MSRSFAYYKWRKANPEKPGRPLVVGSATHLWLQSRITDDPGLMSGILTFDDGSSLTNGFKKFQADNPTKYCLDEAETGLVSRMVQAILDEPAAMDYLKTAIAEPTIMGAYPNTTVPCKCRPDYLHIGKGVSINIKTTTDASESGFIYSTKDYRYDFQSAFYCDLLSAEFGKPFDEVHILVEKTEDGEPVPVKIFSFSDDTISWARAQIHTLMGQIPECEKSGVWPKPRATLEEIDVPLYARKIVAP
jgi:exodeoxyribonuclease VIII